MESKIRPINKLNFALHVFNFRIYLRGTAAANLSESSINRCRNSCRPILGGPMSTTGLL